MKLNRIITLCAVAVTLAISATSLLAQGNNNGPGGGQGRQRGGGGPGGGGFGGGQGGGNFDPAAMLQRQMDNIRQSLNYTNDTEWDAIAPLVQKVLDAQSAVRAGQGRGMFGGGRNRGGGRGGNAVQTPNPEQDALQKALDDAAPAAQVKDLLARYRAAQKAKQAKLEEAQANLKKVLTIPQEAQGVLMGLL